MLGGVLAAAVVLRLGRTRLMQVAELKTYDARVRALADPGRANPDIVIAAIDDRTLREMPQFGWPFPRSVHAAVVDYLQYAGARQVVFDVVFADVDADEPAGDSALADAIAAAPGRAVLPMTMATGRAITGAAYEDSVGLRRFALPSRGTFGLPELARMELPLPMLARGAAALGTVMLNADSTEGGVYAERLAVAHGGRLYPSLGFAAARLADPERLGGAVSIRDGRLRSGRVEVPLHAGEMLIRWRGPFIRGERQTYPVYSYSALARSYDQVAAGEAPTLPPDSLRGKTVLVGATAPGLLDLRRTPFGPTEPGVMIHASVLDNLLTGDFLRRAPGWINAALTILVAVGAASVVALAGSALWGALGAAALVLLAGAGAWLAFAGGVWLDLAAPVLAGALAYSGATAVA
ncbi:MAG TPA: CHASE2 domain-containing protein, partial [Longimicrobiaceae bacterium]|nr:CHASE2 domain-containing protein [Longimicrobiaceae bacterium]